MMSAELFSFGLCILMTLKTISSVEAEVDATTGGIGVSFSFGLVAYLDLSDQSNVTVTNPHSYRWRPHQSTPAEVTALAGDYQSSKLYGHVVKAQFHSISTYSIAEEELNPPTGLFLSQSVHMINGLTFDWLSKTLYWTDASNRLIGAMPAGREVGFISTYLDVLWSTVVSSLVGVPEDIVVNPLKCYLFWSEYEDGSTQYNKISRSDLTGSQLKDIYNTTTGKITRLTIDFTTDRLYWLSPKGFTVGSSDFDGSKTKIYKNKDFGLMTAMTIYQDLLLLGTHSSTSFYIYNLTNATSDLNRVALSSFMLSEGYQLPRGLRSIKHMTTLTETSQPDGPSPCKENNGDCSQFCFTTSPTTKRYGCGNSFILNSDYSSCTAVPLPYTSSCLLAADEDRRKLFQLDTSTNMRPLMLQDIVDPVVPILLTYDDRQNQVFATAINSNGYISIVRMHVNGSNSSILWTAENQATVIGQLAHDSVNQMLYFTDSKYKAVHKLSTSTTGKQAADAIVTSDHSTAAITVDPANGLIYWSECPRGKGVKATIKCANATDGSGRKTLLTADLPGTCYTSIALDVNDQKLYWTSITYDLSSTFVQSTVEQAFTDGTQKSTLSSSRTKVFTRLTLLDQSLFVIVRASAEPTDINYIAKINVITRGGTEFHTWLNSLTDITAFNTDRQLRPHVTPTTPKPSSNKPPSLTVVLVAGLCGAVLLLVGVALIVVYDGRRKMRERRSALLLSRTPLVQEQTPEDLYDEVQLLEDDPINNAYLELVYGPVELFGYSAVSKRPGDSRSTSAINDPDTDETLQLTE